LLVPIPCEVLLCLDCWNTFFFCLQRI